MVKHLCFGIMLQLFIVSCLYSSVDLTIAMGRFTASRDVRANDQVNVPVIISNLGDATSSATVVKAFFSKTVDGIENALPLESWAVAAVAPGEQVSINANIVIPEVSDPDRGWYLVLVVDPNSLVSETDEGNNSFEFLVHYSHPLSPIAEDWEGYENLRSDLAPAEVDILEEMKSWRPLDSQWWLDEDRDLTALDRSAWLNSLVANPYFTLSGDIVARTEFLQGLEENGGFLVHRYADRPDLVSISELFQLYLIDLEESFPGNDFISMTSDEFIQMVWNHSLNQWMDDTDSGYAIKDFLFDVYNIYFNNQENSHLLSASFRAMRAEALGMENLRNWDYQRVYQQINYESKRMENSLKHSHFFQLLDQIPDAGTRSKLAGFLVGRYGKLLDLHLIRDRFQIQQIFGQGYNQRRAVSIKGGVPWEWGVHFSVDKVSLNEQVQGSLVGDMVNFASKGPGSHDGAFDIRAYFSYNIDPIFGVSYKDDRSAYAMFRHRATIGFPYWTKITITPDCKGQNLESTIGGLELVLLPRGVGLLNSGGSIEVNPIDPFRHQAMAAGNYLGEVAVGLEISDLGVVPVQIKTTDAQNWERTWSFQAEFNGFKSAFAKKGNDIHNVEETMKVGTINLARNTPPIVLGQGRLRVTANCEGVTDPCNCFSNYQKVADNCNRPRGCDDEDLQPDAYCQGNERPGTPCFCLENQSDPTCLDCWTEYSTEGSLTVATLTCETKYDFGPSPDGRGGYTPSNICLWSNFGFCYPVQAYKDNPDQLDVFYLPAPSQLFKYKACSDGRGGWKRCSNQNEPFFQPEFSSNIQPLGEPMITQLGNTNEVLYLQPNYEIGEVRVGTTRTILVHFKNRTDAPLTTTIECVGHNSFSFSGPSSHTLAAKEDKWIPISFRPQDTESHSATVVVRTPGHPPLATTIAGGAASPPWHPFQPVITGLPEAITLPDTAISGESMIQLNLHNGTETNYQAMQLYMTTNEDAFVLDPENPQMPGPNYWIRTNESISVNLRFRPREGNRTYTGSLRIRAFGGEGLTLDRVIPITGRSTLH